MKARVQASMAPARGATTMRRTHRLDKPFHSSGGACPRHGSPPESPPSVIRQQSLKLGGVGFDRRSGKPCAVPQDFPVLTQAPSQAGQTPPPERKSGGAARPAGCATTFSLTFFWGGATLPALESLCCSLRRGAPHFGCRRWSHLPAPACLHQRRRHVAEASEQSEQSTGDSPAASVVRQQQRHTPQLEVGDSRHETQDQQYSQHDRGEPMVVQRVNIMCDVSSQLIMQIPPGYRCQEYCCNETERKERKAESTFSREADQAAKRGIGSSEEAHQHDADCQPGGQEPKTRNCGEAESDDSKTQEHELGQQGLPLGLPQQGQQVSTQQQSSKGSRLGLVPQVNLRGKTGLARQQQEIEHSCIQGQKRKQPGDNDKDNDAPLLDLTLRPCY